MGTETQYGTETYMTGNRPNQNADFGASFWCHLNSCRIFVLTLVSMLFSHCDLKSRETQEIRLSEERVNAALAPMAAGSLPLAS